MQPLRPGVTFIDTAEIYGGDGASERMLGEALKGRREKVVLATKFGHFQRAADNAPGSRRNMRRAVEASLTRLQTDYIDLYYLHFPDPVTPIAETLAAFTELIAEGKLRYIATCNFAAWQLVEAEWTARTEHTARIIAGPEPVQPDRPRGRARTAAGVPGSMALGSCRTTHSRRGC